jgi:hypothetical protein
MRPSLINPFENERGIIDSAIHHVSLCHVRFVEIKVKELPGGKPCSC